MLAFWSCEGVVFLVHSSSSHFTVGHVFPLPLSGANWRSLSLLWGSDPPLSKMAPPSTRSAHTPFPGSETRMALDSETHCNPFRQCMVLKYNQHFPCSLVSGLANREGVQIIWPTMVVVCAPNRDPGPTISICTQQLRIPGRKHKHLIDQPEYKST